VDPLDLLAPDSADPWLHVVHNLLDFFAKLIRRQARHETGAQVSRMNRNFRIAHAGIILSFPRW